jgi:predicted short-subunit dehydrogenase-like oxidoreductase (DUF2520 family)
MPRKGSIAIVGVGRLGTALASELAKSGYRIDELVIKQGSRPRPGVFGLATKIGAKVVQWQRAKLNSDVIWFCVPDGVIASAAVSAVEKTEWRKKIVFHSSAALTSNELEALQRGGAAVASIHPMMTFAAGSMPSLRGVTFSIEGDPSALRVASRVARDLGGRVFLIRKEHKPLYHVFGGFMAPLLVSLLQQAENMGVQAGLASPAARRAMQPIVRQTIENFLRDGGAAAFTGPLARGDIETIKKHLNVLGEYPDARAVYLALARAALNSLPVKNREELQQLLQ